MFEKNATQSESHEHDREDRLLGQLVARRLWKLPYRSFKQISCKVERKTVTMCGRVPSYYLKDLAELSVSEIGGVEEIENRLEVVGAETWHHVQETHPRPPE